MHITILFRQRFFIALLFLLSVFACANERSELSQFEIPHCIATKGKPSEEAADHEIRIFPDFILCYRESYEQPEWVAYQLTKDELTKNVNRSDDFRPDTNITSSSADLDDYRGSGYDRGHLAPAADFSFSKEAMSNTFFMSNMSPQNPAFNRGIWAKLEAKVRTWAHNFESVYVITGPILEKPQYETIGINEVAVPDFYYKVLCAKDPINQAIIMIAFILPNEKSSDPLEYFAVSIDELEKRTSLDFFHLLPNKIEKNLEEKIDFEHWFDIERDEQP
ncbi:MAG: DNA/RNA non-specific endonuclease [Treponemataceae bacterium]